MAATVEKVVTKKQMRGFIWFPYTPAVVNDLKTVD
jgi:hypothetical protein